MTEYHVIWRIDVSADSPEDAAREALRIQRDRESTATTFTVYTIKKVGDWPGRDIDIDEFSD